MLDEKVVWDGRPEWRAYGVPLGVALLLALMSVPFLFVEPGSTVITLIPGLLIVALVALSRFSADYKVTNKRIICKNGILSTKTSEIDICDIRSINVTQGLVQKIFRVGDVEFTTASGPLKEAVLKNIDNPDHVKERIRGCKNISSSS